MTQTESSLARIPGTPKTLPKYAQDRDRPYEGDPWQRQKDGGETKRAWERFQIFLELDPDIRSIAKADDIYRTKHGMELTTNHTYAYKVAATHRWTERVEAYDNWMASKKAAALKRRRVKAAERHADEIEATLSVLASPGKKLADRIRKQLAEQGFDFMDSLDDGDLLKLTKAFAGELPGLQKAEREALGAADEATPVPAKQLHAKGMLLRKFMADRSMVEMAEAFVIEQSQDGEEAS